MTWDDFEKDVTDRAVLPLLRTCPVCNLMESEGPEAKRALQAAMDNPAFSTRAIWDALRARGFKIGREKIGHHRRGVCQ